MGSVLRILALFLMLTTPAFASYDPGAGPGGGVSSVTGALPITCTAGTTPVCSISGSGTCANDGVHAITNPTGNAFACTALTVGTGTVTSVGMTMAPTWLTVTGSPITTSGIFAVTATTGQVANRVIASPDGTTGAVSLRALVGADLPNPGAASKGGVFSKASVASQWLKQIGPDGSVTSTQPNYTDLSGSPLVNVVPTTVTVSGATGLVLPASPLHSMQTITMTASGTITIPLANWAGQHLELFVCQNGTGGWFPTFSAAPGLTLHASFPTPTTTANKCDAYGIAYTDTGIAFLQGYTLNE